MSNNVRFSGTRETIRRLKRFGQIGETRIKQITQVTAQEIGLEAKRNLSAYPNVDVTGNISQSINWSYSNDGLTGYVNVNAVPMAAYIEFGTGTYVDVPPGWESIAWAFYVNGKGYTHPNPYLYPAYYNGRRQYKKDLKDALDDLTRRYNI